jgi:hypothetical protein
MLKMSENMSHIHMTYLVGFIIIGVKGLFHSDWLGASPIGPQLRVGKNGKSRWIWQVFLTVHRHHPHPLVAQLLHSSADLGQITSTVYSLSYVTYLSKII